MIWHVPCPYRSSRLRAANEGSASIEGNYVGFESWPAVIPRKGTHPAPHMELDPANMKVQVIDVAWHRGIFGRRCNRMRWHIVVKRSEASTACGQPNEK